MRMGSKERYGSSVKVNVDLNGTRFSTTEWGLWEEDEYLSHARTERVSQLVALCRFPTKKIVTKERHFIQETTVKFGDVGCLDDGIVKGLFASWGNQSFTLLQSQKCVHDGGAPGVFDSVLFDTIETQILLCAYRASKAIDILFVTPPDNVVGPSCREYSIQFGQQHHGNQRQCRVCCGCDTLFLRVLATNKKPGACFSRPNSPDSPLSTVSTENNTS